MPVSAPSLDPQAQKLNDAIAAANPAVLDLLSQKGKAIFFPKLGILSQSAEAQGKEINATIGIALEEDGSPLVLGSLKEGLKVAPKDAFTYAPSPGRPDLRKLWKDMLGRKNPSLAGKGMSTPVVSSALTHGLSMCGYLFCDEGDTVVLPDLYWENYDLLFTHAYGAALQAFPTYAGGGFNVKGMAEALAVQKPGPGGKKILCLNFPNNPSGYTPTVSEVKDIVTALKKEAESGTRLLVLIDDAYFGLVFEEGVYKESIFAELCDLHENLLAVKVDGPTKEDYVWGFRVGFITFGVKGGTAALYEALEAKAGGAIRGNISNSSHPAQSLLLKSWSSEAYEGEKKRAFEVLEARYRKIKDILAAHPEYREAFESLPYNSGYFMCVRPKADPEKLRQKLLADYSTGVISLGGVIRVAFSATPLARLEKLFDNIYRAAKALQG